MQTQHASLRSLLLASGAIFAAFGAAAFAADVTAERLANPTGAGQLADEPPHL